MNGWIVENDHFSRGSVQVYRQVYYKSDYTSTEQTRGHGKNTATNEKK